MTMAYELFLVEIRVKLNLVHFGLDRGSLEYRINFFHTKIGHTNMLSQSKVFAFLSCIAVLPKTFLATTQRPQQL